MDLFVFVCCVCDSVCELVGETIRNMFGCGCYFFVECYGGVGGGALLDEPCMVFQRMCVHQGVPSIGSVYVCLSLK